MIHEVNGWEEDDDVGMLCTVPTAECRKCHAEQPDLDGFGVLYCEACGYCMHPTCSEGKCELCGRVEDQPDTKP